MRRAKRFKSELKFGLKNVKKCLAAGAQPHAVVTMPPLVYNWSSAAGCPLFYVFHAMTLACLTASAGSLKYNVSQSMCSKGRKRVAYIIGERQAACTFCVAEGVQ